jgi:alkylhydroperoxidase family enzyme
MARIELPDGDGEELMRAFGLAPSLALGAGAFSEAVYSDSGLPVRLREIIRMRIAQLNQCHI